MTMRVIVLQSMAFALIIMYSACTSLLNRHVHEQHGKMLRLGMAVAEKNYDAVYFSMDYYLALHRWPVSKKDLSDYAVKKNHQLDFDKYTFFSIEQCSAKRINIHFVIKEIKVDDCILNDVKGIAGIYIENADKVILNKYELKALHYSITVGKNPYTERNSPVIDGYSVHYFIEHHDPKVNVRGNIHQYCVPGHPINVEGNYLRH